MLVLFSSSIFLLKFMSFTNKSTFWLLKSPLTFIILTVFMKESGGGTNVQFQNLSI